VTPNGFEAVTIGEALRKTRAQLAMRGDESRRDASLLLAHVVGRDGAWLLAHEREEIDDATQARFAHMVARRAAGEPVAYITGEAWFYGSRFRVTPDVLVPRPESEHLVEAALAFVRARGQKPLRVSDVGTGSGALAIALALAQPELEIEAIDRSSAALEVARANARECGVNERVHFHVGDMLENAELAPFDAIVANLPYVPSAELRPRPDPTAFEPRLALDGGADGLDAYRRLLAQAPGHLALGGGLFMEAGSSNALALAELARLVFPRARVEVRPDYAGLARLVLVYT